MAFRSRLKPRSESLVLLATEFPDEVFIYLPPLLNMLIVSTIAALLQQLKCLFLHLKPVRN
jgi:hypothetical protein